MSATSRKRLLTRRPEPAPEREVAAVYEGGVLRPLDPLDLPEGTELRLRFRAPVVTPVAAPVAAPPVVVAPEGALRAAAWLVGAIALGLAAQPALNTQPLLASVGFLVAAVCVAYGASAPARPAALIGAPARLLHEEWGFWLTLGALLAGTVTFANATGNRYRPENVIPWLLAMASFSAAHLDLRPFQRDWQPQALRAQLRAWLTRERLIVLGLLLGILALGALFRFVALYDNPRDMNSDQAEKLLDVGELLGGTNYIFFERNTGREPWQFHWTAALIRLFGLQPDFMALKIGTALIGWLMLPAVFLLGREVLGTRGALLAMLFAAVASWGVITARYGLRYPLAPCAVAWTLAHLVRGLRRDSRNDMLLAGVWMGIGLQGYTAYRLMIVVAPLLVGLWCGWLLYRGQRGRATRAATSAGLALALALLVMLPLIRYGLERPDQLFYRAVTRLTSQEQAITGSPLLIFLDNLKNVLLMFNLTSDEVWVANLVGRPAMDALLGGLLLVGAVGSLALSWRTRNPWPAAILLAGVAMLIPSALSIAFPRENPSVVRTGGALPMLMIVCATGPAMLLEALRRAGRPRLYAAGLAGVAALALLVANLNRERVFVEYPAQYCPRAQNASDMGAEMRAWLAAGGERRNAWIVGYPHWVDSRAVGVWIGEITFPNTVMGPEQVRQVDLGGAPGFFLLNRDDLPTLQALYERYPQGQERMVEGSLCAGRAFLVFETNP